PFTRLVHIVSAPVWYLGRRNPWVVNNGPASPGGGGRIGRGPAEPR
ncbi:respiratory nitrate reductase subunit gamma, partial [Pseudomonas aeruginosa]